MGSMKTQESGVQGGFAGRYLATHWIPRAIRCKQCGEIARDVARERISNAEVIVRYGCGSCRSHQTRHYHEAELGVSG